MNSKPTWKQPRLIAIDPFGGATVSPFEVNTSIIPFTLAPTFVGPYGIGWTVGGDNTSLVFPPFTDFDIWNNPSDGSDGFVWSTIAPYS